MFTNLTRIVPFGAVAVALSIAVPISVTAAPYTVSGPAASYTATVSTDSGNNFRGTSAGPFTLTDTDPSATLATFIAWCFDIDNTVAANGTTKYNYTTTPYLESSELKRVQSVFDANYSTSFPTSLPDTAAFQLAIWNAVYDTDDDWSVTTGAFRAQSATPNTNPTILDQANVFLGEAKADFDADNGNFWTITQLNGTGAKPGGADAQGLGYATIPLPAAAWLLLGVSGGLVAAKRRSARRA